MEPRTPTIDAPRTSCRNKSRGKVANLLILGASATMVAVILRVRQPPPPPPPPKVALTGSQVVDLVDDRGLELRLITFQFLNTNPPATSWYSTRELYLLAGQDDVLEEDDQGAWRTARIAVAANTLPRYVPTVIGPNTFWQISLLAPRANEQLAVRLRYAGPSDALLWRYRLYDWIDRSLPGSVGNTARGLLAQLAGSPRIPHREPWNELIWEIPPIALSSNAPPDRSPVGAE
ncbi:MAG: hypothetical protein JNL97_08265 [Verrucomicrobiales bacterium]|nr:hypothetical protein [Verrucomicrobiales bacterium]